jgi:hypothetical protein
MSMSNNIQPENEFDQSTDEEELWNWEEENLKIDQDNKESK